MHQVSRPGTGGLGWPGGHAFRLWGSRASSPETPFLSVSPPPSLLGTRQEREGSERRWGSASDTSRHSPEPPPHPHHRAPPDHTVYRASHAHVPAQGPRLRSRGPKVPSHLGQSCFLPAVGLRAPATGRLLAGGHVLLLGSALASRGCPRVPGGLPHGRSGSSPTSAGPH